MVTSYTEAPNSIVYPNPFQHEFQLDVTSEIRSILIYNSLGQIITPISLNQSNGSVTINIADQKAGFYLLEVIYLNGEKELKTLSKN